MLNNRIELEVFQETIQRLTFTHCIELKEVCVLIYQRDIINERIENCYRKNEDDEDDDYKEDMLFDDYNMIIKRLGRILERLCTENHATSTAGKLIDKPKRYDDMLFEKQVEVYNEPADRIGYKRIEKVLPISLIKDAAFLDNATPTYNEIAKHYPYFPEGKRNGVNFIEFILLINMFFSVKTRGLNLLNKPIITRVDKNNVKKMVDRINDNMRMKDMYAIYIHAFLDIFDIVMNKCHNEKAEKYIRIAWLPEHYRQRKDAFRAFVSHQKDEKKLPPGNYEKNQIENILKTGDVYEKMRLYNSMVNYNATEYIDTAIMPIAVRILLEAGDGIQEYKNTLEYDIAKDYAEVIRMYIDTVVDETCNVLNELYMKNI